MIEFFNTPMGRRFFEGTMPSIARSLEEIAEATKKECEGCSCKDAGCKDTPKEESIKPAQQALIKYGGHTEGCDYPNPEKRGYSCSCGYLDAIEEAGQ